MKRLSVAVRMLAAFGLALSMLAALGISTSAAPNPSGGGKAFWDGFSIPPLFGATPAEDVCGPLNCWLGGDPFDHGSQEVYFPAVGNADESTGLGAAQTSITVQNLSVDDAYIFIYVGTPEDDDGVDLDNWDVVEYAYLSGGASKTFQGSDLEIPAGDVRPVAVAGYSYVNDVEGLSLMPVVLAGVAKQAVTGTSLPFTTTADSAVSGYNAISGRELGYFDQLYFPIVQTNCGPGGCWNSILRIANMGWDDNAAVTVRFFPADDGSGSLQTGFQLQGLVDVGETWSIDLSEWVPEGWVGSAHVYTDDAVGAIVDRVKPGTDMWITNTASNATPAETQRPPVITREALSDARYVLFAPDVRTDYNGWNTGINVANTVDADTQVSIQYFGSNGNAPAAQTRRLAAHGMTYFYNPSDPSEDRCNQPATDVPGCEFIGGAIILSSNPVAVAVDGVKYFGNDANVGQAFSYSATANAYDVLHAALVQKGNPANGMGATSGINFMNPNADATTVETTWLNPSGFEAPNFGSSIVWVPGYATGFVYTMFHSNLPNGYVGSAIVLSDLPVVATTANVDYQVDGDGTAIWNLSNPCGFFRQTGDCFYRSPLEPSATNATLTQQVFVENPFIVEDEDDNEVPEAVERTPLAGVLVTYSGTDTNGFAVSGSGRTGANGSITFAVPAGTYTVTLSDLPDAPAGYVYTGTLQSAPVDINANEARTLTTILTLAIAEGTGTLTKHLVNTGAYTSLESEVYFCPGIAPNFKDSFGLCMAAAVVTAGYGEQGNAAGEVSADLPAGAYTICTNVEVWFDADTDGEQDAWETLFTEECESSYVNADGDLVPILVLDEQTTHVVNNFDDQTEGILDIYVRDDVTDLGIAAAEVCVYDMDGVELDCGITQTTGFFTYLPAGTYRVAVMADGYEQESTVITYSPVADAADGVYDEGDDADVVIALDPYVGPTGQILFSAGFSTGPNTGPVDGTPVTFYAAAVGDVEGSGANGGTCTGAVLATSATVGGNAPYVTLPVGPICIRSTMTLPNAQGGSIVTFNVIGDNVIQSASHVYTAPA